MGSSLEAAVELRGDWARRPEARAALEAFGDLADIFVVSEVRFVQENAVDTGDSEVLAEEEAAEVLSGVAGDADGPVGDMPMRVRVVTPTGPKCPRCWKFTVVEGQTLCAGGCVRHD